MTRAIIVAFHKYTPFGGEFYEPILDFFIQNMKKYENEYEKIYFVDSNWNIDPSKLTELKAEIVKVDPHLRYYDAYKKVLPQIKEDLVLFMDNDMIVYREKMISGTFDLLESLHAGGKTHTWDIVSIYDTIGEYQTDKMNGKNKFCPYWFATRKELLINYLDIDWGPNMPHSETLGKLTEFMLNDGLKPYEWEEDKSNYLYSGTTDIVRSKDLGYYHIRAGSTPAYLLATRKYGDIKTYNDYLKNQPKDEYLRQCAWYKYMGGDPTEITDDVEIPWHWFHVTYFENFKRFHNLP